MNVTKIDELPSSFEAERAVLGAILIDNTTYDDISAIILERDFFSYAHKAIYSAISSLITTGIPADLFSVNDRLSSFKKLEAAGGSEYLIDLVSSKASAANAISYANLVFEASVRRDLISESTEIAKLAYHTDGTNLEDVLNMAEAKIFKLSERGDGSRDQKNMTEILADIVADIDYKFENPSAIHGLSTGFKEIDNLTNGFQKSDLIILAGRPSMGKTTLALNFVQHAVISQKKKALIFSLEMSPGQLATKFLSSLAMIDSRTLSTGGLAGDDWSRLSSAISILNASNASLHIDDSAGLTAASVRSRARKKHKEWGGLDLIVIDYIQLMAGSGKKGNDNRTEEISEISRSLKLLAKELNIPVIALSQLNRSLESRADKRPQMSDLRDSGAIEQDADLVMFVYRDQYYNKESADKGLAEVILSKQRNGPTGVAKLRFQGLFSRFDDIASNEYSYKYEG